MVMHEQNSDFLEWVLGYGFHASPPETLQIIEDHDYSDVQHVEYCGGYESARHSNVENDEIIARTLQEDFSRIEIIENSGNPGTEDGYPQDSTGDYYWHDRPVENYPSEWSFHEHEDNQFEETIHINSCSSPGNSEECLYSVELADEYELDGEVGKRLNQMIQIPYVPRINGEIPSEDEAISDHERLSNRIQLYGFVEHRVQGDGNCQFRALSDQLYNTPESHKLVRRHIVNQLKSNPDVYEGYVPMDYSEYLKKMSRSGEWGDHVTLQAAADAYGVKILVITSFKDTCYIEILPTSQNPKGGIFLSFWAEVHYNSIYFQGDMPSNELPRKKRWWRFGS